MPLYATFRSFAVHNAQTQQHYVVSADCVLADAPLAI